jgi:hypothetical protein
LKIFSDVREKRGWEFWEGTKEMRDGIFHLVRKTMRAGLRIGQRTILRSRRLYSTEEVNTSQGEGFSALYSRLDERLARERLNTTNRNLVYRPRRARELQNRREPIIVNGEALEPRVWPGKPRAADLTRCIREVSNEDEFNQLKYLIKDYVKYYPEKFEPHHLVSLIRHMTFVGLFPEAVTFLDSPAMLPFHGEAYYKELARIYSVRMESLNIESVEHTGVSRYFSKFARAFARAEDRVPGFANNLDAALIRLTGLKRLENYGVEDQALVAEVRKQENAAIDALTNTSAEEQLAARTKGQLAPFCIDLLRASAVFDAPELKAIRDAVCSKFKNTDFVGSYVERLKDGMSLEFKPAPGAEEDEE